MKPQIICESEAIEPTCRHFGSCGGCRFQHIPYDEQLSQKERFVQTLFDQPVEPIIGCEPPWHYRNKMEYTFSQTKAGEQYLGLMLRAKRGRVLNLDECFLTDSWFTDTLQQVRDWWSASSCDAYFPPKDIGALRTLTLRYGIYTGEKMAILTHMGPFDDTELVDVLSHLDSVIFRQQISMKGVPTRFEERVMHGKDHILEELHDVAGRAWTFKIRPASFFQPNTKKAEVLYQKVVELGEISSDDLLLDLYCGTGSLALFASQHAKRVIGVELVPEAVCDAKDNALFNQVDNCEFLEGDVGKVLGQIEEKPAIVIIDPPRAGLGKEAIGHLLTLLPPKILYVSCNPSTQVADCRLLEEGGYRIEVLQPIDQFPHTPHLENVAFLKHIPSLSS